MENNTFKNNPDVIISSAIEKIKAEFKAFTGGSKEKAVSSYVSRIIQDFCSQDVRFAEVVLKFKRTLSDCCKDVMHGVGSHISDIDVYRGAVKFYFPNAEVSMNMTIEITGDAPEESEILKEAEKPKEKKEAKHKAEKATAEKPKKETKPVPPEPKAEKKKAPGKNKAVSDTIQLSLF